MQSLFSRVRSSSSKNFNQQQQQQQQSTIPGPSSAAYDEFGRERSSSLWPPGGDGRSNGTKNKAGTSARQRTLSAPGPPKDLPQQLEYASDLPPLPTPDVVFHPLYIPSKRENDAGERDYGYLGVEHEVILALDDVQRLVAVVGAEISSRAVTTPLLFSSRALDVSANRVRSLVRSFLASCHRPAAPTGEAKWREDARLAGPHELGMLLRWGLARLVRVSNGQYLRGFLDWDLYAQWKMDEEALRFPPSHFTVFMESVSPAVQPILSNLFDLLSRLCAYSAQSGLTPIALSTLFGPLLFGLGSDSGPFSQAYAAYLRSSHAAEHLILSYIRNVEVESINTASSMPPRLKDWIRGYPVMVSPIRDLEKPRRGSKLVRVATARRNVRLYSPDLVKTSASWGSEGDMASRKEWQRVVADGMPPRYTDDYRKRLDIPLSYTPSISSFGSRSSLDAGPALSTAPSSANGAKAIAFNLTLDDHMLDATPVKTFSSLNDLRWGEFEDFGFSESDSKKLQFDLNEGARLNRNQKRSTMSWNDFSSIGFLREDAPLSDTLQFSTPVASTINAWPAHADDITRKLKKTQKVLPTFGWDTSPVSGQDWTIEEGFIASWADLLLSTGWMDKREGTFREANWAFVEFKALPVTADHSLAPTADPRTASQWFLFEEFVPREYREQLLAPPKKGSKSLFSPKGKNKSWKPATTLNGRPYNGTPLSPDAREVEFDAMLRSSDSRTKVVSLSATGARSQTLPNIRRIPPSNNYAMSSKATPSYAREDSPTPAVPPKDKTSSPLARFKLAGSASKRSTSKYPSEYDPDLDFETKTASDSSGGELSPTATGKLHLGGHSRRQSKDDAWVDILVSSGRRMVGQEATMRASPDRYDGYFPPNGSATLRTPKTSLTRARSDPEMGRDDIGRAMLEHLSHAEEVAAPSPYDNEPTMSYRSPQQPYDDFNSYVAASEEDEEEVMEVPRASVIEPLGGPAIRVHASGHHGVEPSDETDFEPASSPALSGVRPLSPADSGYEPRQPVRRPSPNGLPAANPLRAVSAQDSLPATTPPARKGSAGGGGGIGSLIQMYAKKDEEAMKAIYEPKASKLPVRLGPTQAAPTTPPASASPKVPSPARSASPDLTTSPPPPLEDPINRLLNPSPARYVHGAPLHNVLEEDSEEG